VTRLDPPSTPASAPPGLVREDSGQAPAWARRLARLLDSAVRIPGTNIRIGLDPILGLLLPELGDALGGVMSVTLLLEAFRRRVPKLVMGRMLVNIAVDALIGAVPLLGDAFDFVFRANDRNLALLERYRGDPHGKATLGDALVVAAALLIALALVALPVVIGYRVLRWLLTDV
jgi:hypothetical protein